MKMWRYYEVELQFEDRFASALPKNPKELEDMFFHRMPSEKSIEKREERGENIVPAEEMVERIKAEVQADEEAPMGYATFKRDEGGLYYEARCVKSHMEDSAEQIRSLLDIRALRPKVKNRVYVKPQRIYLDKENPDGYEVKPVQAMTRRGPISTLKCIDYLLMPLMKFRLKVLDDDVITKSILDAIFEYGGEHGMGQERGEDWGKYKVVKFEEVKNWEGSREVRCSVV